MTPDLQLPDLQEIDAWIDGESVSPSHVLTLLASEEARTYAVDVMAMRRLYQRDLPMLPVARQSRWRPLAAAAALVLTAGGGFFAGQWLTPAPETGTSTLALETANQPAPAPTRVIQFEVGVDWRESSGGN